MHNTAPHLLAYTDEGSLGNALPACRSSFCDIKGAVSTLLPSQEVKVKQQPFFFRMCYVSRFPLAVSVPALGCYAHCRASPAAEISVVTAGRRTCQEAQEINGTAAMLMLSLIM